MSTEFKPIKVWGRFGPNPPKVAILLKELGLPYEIIDVPLSDVKKPEYVAINPNGRIPAIQDPNTGITLWESGAILEYLIDHYDTEHRLSFDPKTPEAWHAKQWLFFQVSGQGPYYGQAVWFTNFHSEKLPSAIERYVKEVNRVTGVLEGHLARQKSESSDGPWLVGGKLSYVDLAFVSWQYTVDRRIGKSDYDIANYPLVKEWYEKLIARPAVKAVLEAAFQPPAKK